MQKWESKDHQFIDIMISIIDVSTPKAAHMGVIRDYIQMENIDKFKDFYTKPDKYGRGLMHHAALRSPEEFEESILLLDQLFSYDDLDEVMLMHDKKGKIPAQMSDNAAITAFEYFKARPELIAEMLLSRIIKMEVSCRMLLLSDFRRLHLEFCRPSLKNWLKY